MTISSSMKIELRHICIRDLFNGYANNAEEGVVGYGGNLNIRPAFQREFIYKTQQSEEVIRSIQKGFPLNVLYWVQNKAGGYEVLDGQQKIISICLYVDNNLPLDDSFFANLTDEEQEQILNYELMVYFCEGSDRDIIDWFKIINIAGEKLTNQELLNAVYTGQWLSDAKGFFSKTNCAAYGLASDYIKGSPIRQEYLETAIKWIAEEGNVERYMATNQHKENAEELKNYFKDVFAWVRETFTTAKEYKEYLKGVAWGLLYNAYKDASIDKKSVADSIAKLMGDDDVTDKKGIFDYVLTGDEKKLNIRVFDKKQKREAYQRQAGVCAHCKEKFDIKDMQGDHITPWSRGGKTDAANCQMLCPNCNRTKSYK